MKPDFPNNKLPGVEGFDKTEAILESEPDINVGMIDVREKATRGRQGRRRSERARAHRRDHPQAGDPGFPRRNSKNGQGCERLDSSARHRQLPHRLCDADASPITPASGRTTARKSSISLRQGLDGSQTFTQTYPKDALPAIESALFLVSRRGRWRSITRSFQIHSTVICSTSSRR